MARKYRVYYEKQYDRLMIAGKSDEEVMAGSVRLLNVILDFNIENKVVNAELLHASEYLNSLGLNADILTKATNGTLSFRQLRNGYEIVFILMAGKKIVPIPYNIQMPAQKQVITISA